MNHPVTAKPWDSNINGSSFYSSQNQASHFNTDRLYSAPVPFPGGPGGGGGSFINGGVPSIIAPPPPVPPRPTQSRPIYSTAPWNTGIIQSYPAGHNYSSSSPYYYSPYSNFHSYRYGNYNRISHPAFGDDEPTIAELAQESSASVFQSIESFVDAFRSVSSMLESTFHAVYSSFRAVVEVADNLGRVKQVLHTLAIFRFFKWMFRRILYLIGISKIKPDQIESVWNSVVAENQTGFDWLEKGLNVKPKDQSKWPVFAFLGFILAGPYLIWRLLGSMNKKKISNWATGDEDHFIAISEYDFEPGSKNELRLRKGTRIRLAPAPHQPDGIKGWVLASDGNKIGLVPVNYINVIGKGHHPATKIEDNRCEAKSSNVTNSTNESYSFSSSQIDPPGMNTNLSSPSLSRSSSQSTLTPN